MIARAGYGSLVLSALLTAMALVTGESTTGAGTAPPPPEQLRVPTLAYDDADVTLAWRDPAEHPNIVDYDVYLDGRFVGRSSQDNASTAQPYLDRFYADPSSAAQIPVLRDTFTVTGLRPGTRHRFTVRAVDVSGRESRDSAAIEWSTAPVSRVFDVTAYGAVGDGKTVNTRAIQAAINACVPGGTVVIPAGTFVSGALWLKSDMTFKVAGGATLLGSADAADYPYHFLLYPYSTDERFYSLLNAHTYDYGTLHDIRIVGPGTIAGNGWAQNGTDRDGFPISAPSSSATVEQNGILAKSEVDTARRLGNPNPYSVRSSLITVRGVDNMYYGDFTALNPPSHTVVNIRSNHVTVAGLRLETEGVNNADGIEFNQGDGLDVYDNVFDTGDDDMNFAAGLGEASSTDPPTTDAWIAGNYFRKGHGAVVAGSHTGSWIENVTAENNVIDGTDVALRMKTAPTNGGGARHVLFRDNAVRDVTAQAFIFTSAYSDPNAVIAYEPASSKAYFTDVTVRRVTVDGTGDHAIEVTGVSDRPHTDLRFDDVRFLRAKPTSISYLHTATFHDVVFDQTVDPWVISESSGLRFTGTTTVNTVTANAEQAPVWPPGSTVSASATGSTGTTLTWPAATDNIAVTRYRVMRDGQPVIVVPGDSTSARITGLAPALDYRYTVQAGDATGNWTTGPGTPVRTTGAPDGIAPTVPGGADAVTVRPDIGTTWATVTWQPATDNFGVAAYQILVNGGVADQVAGTATSDTITRLRPGTGYRFELRAVDATGNAASYPATATAVTNPPYDTGAPRWPHNARIRLANVAPTTVTIGWTPATDDQRVIGYRVFLDGQPLPAGADFSPVDTTASTADTGYRITGLAPGSRHVVRVEAGDAVGRWTGSGPSLALHIPE